MHLLHRVKQRKKILTKDGRGIPSANLLVGLKTQGKAIAKASAKAKEDNSMASALTKLPRDIVEDIEYD